MLFLWKYLFLGGEGGGGGGGGWIILPPGTLYSNVCLDPCGSYFLTNIPYFLFTSKLNYGFLKNTEDFGIQ